MIFLTFPPCRGISQRHPTGRVKEGRAGLDFESMDQQCPECGGIMLFDSATKRFGCKSCGIFLTRDQLSDLRYKQRTPVEDERRKRSRQHSDYLEWWLSGNKEK